MITAKDAEHPNTANRQPAQTANPYFDFDEFQRARRQREQQYRKQQKITIWILGLLTLTSFALLLAVWFR